VVDAAAPAKDTAEADPEDDAMEVDDAAEEEAESESAVNGHGS